MITPHILTRQKRRKIDPPLNAKGKISEEFFRGLIGRRRCRFNKLHLSAFRSRQNFKEHFLGRAASSKPLVNSNLPEEITVRLLRRNKTGNKPNDLPIGNSYGAGFGEISAEQIVGILGVQIERRATPYQAVYIQPVFQDRFSD